MRRKLIVKIVSMSFVGLMIFAMVNELYALDIDMVKIPGKNYSVMKTEVTQNLYETIMGKNPAYFSWTNKYLSKDQLLSGSTFDYPVENVSWYDAIYFCNTLSESLGYTPVYLLNGEADVTKWNYKPHEDKEVNGYIEQNLSANGFRLPTLKEWQYAARGGENYIYSGSNELDEVAWYVDNSNGVTHPVSSKKPNGYGLYDMSGNVDEWCWDVYGCYYSLRCNCGGSWGDGGNYCKVDSRYNNNADGRYNFIGFRIVRSTGK